MPKVARGKKKPEKSTDSGGDAAVERDFSFAIERCNS